MAKEIYDPWSKIKTRNGYAAEEVISSMQKAVRRADEELACRFAYELYISSPQMLLKMWRRILVMSVEDIGMGDPNAAVVVNNLYQMSKEYEYADGDQPMYFVHALRYLCKCKKDRSSDLLKNIVIKTTAQGTHPEIMDVALDKHTPRGRAMGRDSFHFFHEGSKVTPELEVDNDYKERYLKILEEYDANDNEDTAFEFNSWQC